MRVDLLPWVAVPCVGRWWVQGGGLQRKQLSGFSETDSRTPERANGDLAPVVCGLPTVLMGGLRSHSHSELGGLGCALIASSPGPPDWALAGAGSPGPCSLTHPAPCASLVKLTVRKQGHQPVAGEDLCGVVWWPGVMRTASGLWLPVSGLALPLLRPRGWLQALQNV